MTPTQLRKQHGHATWHTAGHAPGHTPGYATQKSAGTPGAFWPNEPIRLKLGYRPPFAWQELLKYFSYRRIKGLEEVGDSYIRTIQIGQSGGILRVYPEPEKHRFIAEFSLSEPADLSPYTRRIRDLLDLDAAPHEISAHLGQFAPLQIHIKRTPGLRIPGAWTIFEIIVRAIVGQQVSVRAATTVLGRLVEIYGSRLAIEHPGLPNRLFPVSEQLAQQSLTHVGINSAKADTISRIADLFVSDPEFIHSGMRFADARQKLLSVKGIGPWTANYILLRGLRDPDAFPDADLGALRAVGTNDKNELGRLAADWRPWRGYALMYLWSSLDQST